MFRGVRKWCVVLILLCICKDAFSFEQTPSTEYIPVYYSADDVEILFSQSGELEKAKLQGNVKIAFEDIVMKCDIAQFMKETGDITAEGNLSIETSQGIIKADSIIYNLNNKTGVMPNATFLSPPFYGKAEKIEQKGDVFYFINGYITNCDLEKPHWKISAEQLKYAKGEYFRAEKMRIVFGEKYSVFYFPRYTADMKTKEPVVTARPGSSSKVGENIELLFTQRAGEKTDTVTKERILVGEKGLGAGASITSKTQGYRYEGFLYKDWDEGDIEPALLLEFLKHYTSTYGEGNILFDWRYMDNNDLFYTFFHSDYIVKSKKYNYLSLTQNFKQGIFNINFRDSAEDDFLNIEKLPEIRFYTPPFQVGDAPIFIKNDFRMTNFHKEKEDEYCLRTMDVLTLKGHKPAGELLFSPYISLGGLNYSDDEDEWFNFFGEAGTKVSAILKKEHRGFTEYFSPSLTFFYRELDFEKGKHGYFDSFERMEGGNFLTLGMDWFFQGTNAYIGSVSLDNLYDIDSNQIDTTSLKYDVHLTPSLYIEGKNEWDISEESYVFGVNDIIFKSGKYSYSIGNRYDDEGDVSGIEGKFSQVVNELWRYSTGIQYDFHSDTFSKVSLDVWHKMHCWELNIGISGNKDDFSIFIMLSPFLI